MHGSGLNRKVSLLLLFFGARYRFKKASSYMKKNKKKKKEVNWSFSILFILISLFVVDPQIWPG